MLSELFVIKKLLPNEQELGSEFSLGCMGHYLESQLVIDLMASHKGGMGPGSPQNPGCLLSWGLWRSTGSSVVLLVPEQPGLCPKAEKSEIRIAALGL